MREIKFRVWKKDNKKMVTWEELKEQYFNMFAIENSNYKWQQYTGLKDENGIEIYEDDIVRYYDIDVDGGKVHNFLIEWYVDGWFMGYRKLQGRARSAQCGKIIGNIHENLDLIKNK